jgi:hypothetical protein
MRIAGWIAFGGALLAYYGLPHHLRAFELMTFYPRFSVLLVLMGLVVIPAGLRRLDGAGSFLLVAPAVVLGALYGDELVRHYRYYDAEMAEFSTVVRRAAPGRRALGLVYNRYSRVMRIESALVGIPNLYPALRPALQSMNPLVYCGMRHMPCRNRPGRPPLPDPGVWSPQYFNPDAALEAFDYFFVRSPPPGKPIFGEAIHRLRLVAQSGSWLLYEKLPPPPPPPPPPAAPAAPVTDAGGDAGGGDAAARDTAPDR